MAGLTSANGHAMLKQGNLTDFTITCQDKGFHVHRSVISGASDLFRAAVGKDFKEGASGVLDFHEEHSTIVARVLLYIYTGSFTDDPEFDHSDIWHPRGAAEILNHSSRYPDPSSSMQICFQTYAFADQHGLDRLKDVAYNQLMGRAVEGFATTDFSDALKMIYENTSRAAEGLRLIVTRLCIIKHETVKEQPQLLEIVQLHEPMAFRIGVQSIKHDDLGECYKHTQRLKKLERRLQQLIMSIDNNNACGECGAQFAVKLKIRESEWSGERLDLTCSDCGSQWDEIV